MYRFFLIHPNHWSFLLSAALLEKDDGVLLNGVRIE